MLGVPFYRDAGDGPPLLLLHSGGMSSAEWEPLIPRLAPHFRVLAPDLPGHGATPLDGPRLRISDMAQAVISLLDALRIERSHVLGSSMGGVVALWLAIHAPQRVDKLVLFRSNYRRAPEGDRLIAQMADPAWWRSVGMDRWMSRIHEPQGGPEAWKTVIRRVVDAFVTSDEHVHELAQLATVQAPTLIIVGDRDPLVPLEHALEMYRTIPRAALWVMPHATHIAATNTWRRDCFALEVTRFLQRPM